jgi:hypothetical protein
MSLREGKSKNIERMMIGLYQMVMEQFDGILV